MIEWTVRYVFANRGSIIVPVSAPNEGAARMLARQEARRHFDDETLDTATDVVAHRKDQAPVGSLGDVLGRLMNRVLEGVEEAAKTLAMSDHTDYHLASDFKRIRDAAADALKRIEGIEGSDTE